MTLQFSKMSRLVWCFFLVFCLPVWSAREVLGRRWVLSKEEDLELERQLKILNKPYVESFKDDHGVTYDCVDIYKQPAFDHPLLKNHTIQMKPSSFPKGMFNKPSKRVNLLDFDFKIRCPKGTVLIRRTQKEDLIIAREYAQHLQPQVWPDNGNHYAMIVVNGGEKKIYGAQKFYGAQALMDVFTLPNVSINQATASQIILSKGENGPKNYHNTIQFGWQIAFQRMGDDNTHLFTYWTSDGFQKTGCFNMLCPGFIQLSHRTTPGMILQSGKGAIYLSVFRDERTGNWNLLLKGNQQEIVGYWPKAIFNNMADSSQVQIGGIAYSPFGEPTPPMGSGILAPEEGCAEIKGPSVMHGNGEFGILDRNKVLFYTDLKGYYACTARLNYDEDIASILFGGPGGWKPSS